MHNANSFGKVPGSSSKKPVKVANIVMPARQVSLNGIGFLTLVFLCTTASLIIGVQLQSLAKNMFGEDRVRRQSVQIAAPPPLTKNWDFNS
ncbi:hypothetical protein TH5_09385 [Thalassospira xianhensis MCCC 1A02616]|uniref:Uncharacterized protein n=2 Tax=Thalassospira TaxID=168934 RepID=A0A285TXR3_9PROT|nr:hypothetical protein TH5_09385 [Thalassospira xianhensis MCCC 1A02616]SOC30494.1 hypothetical protein SAMN05428964_10962 [Thalassospira xiamenensis]